MSTSRRKKSEGSKEQRNGSAAKRRARQAQNRRLSLGMANAIIRTQRESLVNDLKQLLDTGRITAEEYNAQTANIEGRRLSLTSEGNISAPATQDFINSRKTLPEGAAMPVAQRLSSADSIEIPSSYSGDITAEDAKAFVDEQSERLPELA